MEKIREYALTQGTLRADRVTGTIRDCKLCGLTSSNGRTYPASTLQKALPLYEGAKVNINHGRGREPRGYEDRIGSVANVRFVPGDGLRGDLRINPKHPLAEQLLWDAENAPGSVGLSHAIDAKVSRGKDGNVTVTEIVAVDSVDLVSDPATTQGLFESRSDGQHTVAVKEYSELSQRLGDNRSGHDSLTRRLSEGHQSVSQNFCISSR